MPGRQARLLTEPTINHALRAVCGRPDAIRSRAMLMLSLRGGLRACEIAGLEWGCVLDARGRIDHALTIPDAVAKKGGGRRMPCTRSCARRCVSSPGSRPSGRDR